MSISFLMIVVVLEMAWKAPDWPSLSLVSVIVSLTPLAFFDSSSVTFLARSDLLASSRTSPTRSLMAPSCSLSLLDDFCASDSTMLNFCRADFKASDSSSFWASSRNLRMLSLISLFLSISERMLSMNCEKKPALRPGWL